MAGAASASEPGTIGGRPARPRDDNPRSSSIFVHEATPSEVVEEAVLVINNSTEARVVDVYATDSLVSSGGAFACEQRADARDEEGEWIHLSREQVALAPGEQREIPFTITVPKDASVGEHNACIALQAQEPAVESGVNGVTLSFRTAIRVAITVPGDIVKGLGYESLAIVVHSDKIIVTERLRNSGNVSLDALIETSIEGFLGTSKQSTEGQYPVLAHQSAEFNFELGRPFWGGFYTVISNAEYNADTAASLGDESGTHEVVATSKRVFIAPHPRALALYAGVLAMSVLTVISILVRRLRHGRVTARAAVYVVEKGQTIQAVADMHACDWKKIARINKLKAPYEILEGTELLIPAAKLVVENSDADVEKGRVKSQSKSRIKQKG